MKLANNKKSLLIFFLFLSILFYEPFIFSSIIGGWGVLAGFIIFTLYFLLNTNLNISKKINFYFLFFSLALLIIFLRSSYNSNFLGSSLLELYVFVFSFFYFNFFSQKELLIKMQMFWKKIVLFISVITIISFIISNLNLISFTPTEIGGYPVEFNSILGMVHTGGFIDFKRPSFYFAEPSYLGFFLGLNSLFFVTSLKATKFQTFLMFSASVLTCSKSTILGLSIVFLFFVIFKVLSLKNLKLKLLIMLGILGIFFVGLKIYSGELSALGDASFDSRQERLGNSINIINNSSIGELFLGKGSSYIALTNELGESNAFLKMIVEQGVILSFLILLFVIKMTYRNVFILLYILVTLNYVVILWTPYFFFNIFLIYFSATYFKKPKISEISNS